MPSCDFELRHHIIALIIGQPDALLAETARLRDVLSHTLRELEALRALLP